MVSRVLYVGMIFGELIVLNEEGQIVERIPLRDIKDHFSLFSDIETDYEKEISDKYPGYQLIYLFEKEGKIFKENSHLLRVLLKMNNKNINKIKEKGIDILAKKMKDSFTPDKEIILLFDAVNNYEKILNECVVRIRELAIYIYPGVYEQYSSNKEFVADLSKLSMRYDPLLDSMVDDKEYYEIIQRLSKNALELYGIKENIEKHISKKIKEIMPNTSYLIGEKLTAHLLSEAGSLEKLAFVPSSTIQVIGAEKALFMHLTGRGKSPKHGIIFLSDYIQKAPIRKRGKVARILSLKISKAAKIDYFSRGKEFIGLQLKREMEEVMKKIIKE